jgi:hypothetical protein
MSGCVVEPRRSALALFPAKSESLGQVDDRPSNPAPRRYKTFLQPDVNKLVRLTVANRTTLVMAGHKLSQGILKGEVSLYH